VINLVEVGGLSLSVLYMYRSTTGISYHLDPSVLARGGGGQALVAPLQILSRTGVVQF